MKRILIGLLLALVTTALLPAASSAAPVTPAPGYYWWNTVHSGGGLKEAANFEVRGDKAHFSLLRRVCRGDRILFNEFSGKDKAKGRVPIRNGVASKTQSFRLGGVKYTLAVRVTFTKARKAAGWLRLTGGKCTGTKRKISFRHSGV
ncbi:hypothetical protein LRP67_07600 [Nocardioides sp. cx-169]|uniref:hypothetical protein n=1 Tax=Nocardioides sp. cx-169 TaxID=2899080 RepID=UPI001E628D55|nr:hypothetical protein [Nocardioides sp. cx-169]MCD4533942.1 hypothetical protein [Nocardioides sp. cx-169]